jgi:hypothetical protein
VRRVLLAALAALLAVPADAAPKLSKDEQAKLEAIAERGRLIFELDRAAWVATDDLREQLPNFAEAGVRGYVIEREADGPVVTLYGDQGAGLVAMYVAKIGAGGIVSSRVLGAGERRPLSQIQRRMAEARLAALKKGRGACTVSAFNTAIIPPASEADPVDVYLLTAQTETGVHPFGGHYLVRVGSDGGLISERAFTKACINLRDDPKAVGLFLSHVLDPRPTEIHVFLSLSMNRPVFVGTHDPKRVWVVERGRIKPMGKR